MNFAKWASILVCLAGAGFAATLLLKPKAQRNAEGVREIATRGLSEYLARTRPGERLLVFSNPFTRLATTAPAIVKMEEAGLRGLKEGGAGKLTVAAVVFPDLRPGALENPQSFIPDPESSTPLSYLVTPEAFDVQAKSHVDCGLIVSLIGLPAELDRCEIWTRKGPPAFVLLLPDLGLIGGAETVKQAVDSGKLVAFVLRRPGGPPDSEPPSAGFNAEFEKRFVLVTRENFDEVAKLILELR